MGVGGIYSLRSWNRKCTCGAGGTWQKWRLRGKSKKERRILEGRGLGESDNGHV